MPPLVIRVMAGVDSAMVDGISSPEALDGAADLTEDLILALPSRRWGSWWFGPPRSTPVQLHYDPDHMRFRFTDAVGRSLPTDRCEELGGEQVVAAKERLVHVHSTRLGITERLRRKQSTVSLPAGQTPPPMPTPVPATVPVTPGVITTPDGQIEVAPFADVPGDPVEQQPATARTTSVFRTRKTKAVDIIARVRNTNRHHRGQRQEDPPSPFDNA